MELDVGNLGRGISLLGAVVCLPPAFAQDSGTADELAAIVAPLPPLPPVVPSVHAHQPAYGRLDRVVQELERWRMESEGLAAPLDLGTTADGTPVPALILAGPGPIPAAERPTVLLLGGLDGMSLSGGEAVLACIADFLAHPETLGPDLALIAVPWASPDALLATFEATVGAREVLDGRTRTPLDDDGDGRIDEDPPQDLDEDGRVLWMLIENSRGPWARCSDSRFLAQARPGDAPRFDLVREGADDDGDGAFNEDPLGGVVLDLDFPVGRKFGGGGRSTAALPLSEPLSKAYADLALSRKLAAIVLFQGNHGQVAAPGGVELDGGELVLSEERALFERTTGVFTRLAGRPDQGFVSLRMARGVERPGAALDWFYAVVGSLAIEVAPWGPSLFEHGAPTSHSKPAEASASFAIPPPAPSARDRAWSGWNDRQGGMAFVDWSPIELQSRRRAFVGGWLPLTFDDPPHEELARALEGSAAFVHQLCEALPRLELEPARAVERQGELLRFAVRVRNVGVLPTGLSTARSARRFGIVIELSTDSATQIVAGDARVELPPLAGSEASRDLEWLVIAPPGARILVRAHSPWARAVEWEVER